MPKALKSLCNNRINTGIKTPWQHVESGDVSRMWCFLCLWLHAFENVKKRKKIPVFQNGRTKTGISNHTNNEAARVYVRNILKSIKSSQIEIHIFGFLV